MIKYTTTQVTFREIPDEITLCINISNCPIHCPDCHSKELWKDIGEELTEEKLISLIKENKGISCICFMGGNSDEISLFNLAETIKKTYPDLKTAWYSGYSNTSNHPFSCVFDYIKYGPYIKEKGGLDSPTTNQELWQYIYDKNEIPRGFIKKENITYKFWKNGTNISEGGMDIKSK